MVRIFYITNDVERAAVPMSIEGVEYHIITFRNPFSEYLSKPTQTGAQTDAKLYNIFLVDGPKVSTEELMKRLEVIEYIQKQINRHSKLDLESKQKKQKQKDLNFFGSLDSGSKAGMTNPFIVVFKPTLEVEEYCKKMGWKLLNPFSRISEECEEKISQIKLLKSLKVPVPKYATAPLGKCGFKDLKRKLGTPLILQYNLGHTGEGTLVIKSEEDLEALKKKFSKRPVRVSEFIEGVPITVNAVAGKSIYISSPSLQITGIPLLTSNTFATVGNDWSWVSRNKEHITRINSVGAQDFVPLRMRKIVIKIGKALKKRGFRGAFGVDVMVDKKNRLYVIEVNSRQPASVVYESNLQANSHGGPSTSSGTSLLFPERSVAKSKGHNRETTMSLHLKCLLGKDTGKERLPKTLEGSQIFVRAKEDLVWNKSILPRQPSRNDNNTYFIFSKLNKGDVVKKNSEVLRIQSRGGMVERPMKLKKEVKKILTRYSLSGA